MPLKGRMISIVINKAENSDEHLRAEHYSRVFLSERKTVRVDSLLKMLQLSIKRCLNYRRGVAKKRE